jgi:type VI secretion system protein ImpM
MAVQAPGFFGKLPSRGDFLDRRVPPALRRAWEDWLTRLTAGARVALGEAWPEDWLGAPLWHFALGAGLAPPDGAAGILLASADRVGRLFPFTIIAPAAGAPDAGGRADWLRQAEALVLAALDDDGDPETLDAGLQALGPPPPAPGAPRQPGHWPLALTGDWPDSADMLDDAALMPPGPGQSTWWCRGSARLPAMHLRCDGLPDAALAVALVTGGFDPAA